MDGERRGRALPYCWEQDARDHSLNAGLGATTGTGRAGVWLLAAGCATGSSLERANRVLAWGATTPSTTHKPTHDTLFHLLPPTSSQTQQNAVCASQHYSCMSKGNTLRSTEYLAVSTTSVKMSPLLSLSLLLRTHRHARRGNRHMCVHRASACA